MFNAHYMRFIRVDKPCHTLSVNISFKKGIRFCTVCRKENIVKIFVKRFKNAPVLSGKAAMTCDLDEFTA